MPNDLLDTYWSICLINECSEAKAAELQNANMDNGKNGYSFGVKQFDLATNEEAGEVLADILLAVGEGGASPLHPGDIDRIRGKALKKPVAQIESDRVLDALRRRAAAALRLPACVQRLRDQTRGWMARDVNLVKKQIAGFSNAIEAQALFANTPFGVLFLLDYENLFGSTIDQFKEFIEGRVAHLNKTDQNPDGTAITAANPVHLTELMRYVLATRQGLGTGETGRADVLRRLNTVVRFASPQEGQLPLEAADRTWLTGTLAPILTGRGNPYIAQKLADGEYRRLEQLIASAH